MRYMLDGISPVNILEVQNDIALVQISNGHFVYATEWVSVYRLDEITN